MGPARTFTPIDVWDIQFTTSTRLSLPVPEGHTTIVVVFKGSIGISGGETVGPAEAGPFAQAGDHIITENTHHASMLLCCLANPLTSRSAGAVRLS